MQKFYRFSAAILIVSLVLLTAPPARAGHVIAAAVDPVIFQLFSLTNTGEVYEHVGGGTWTLIGTVPGAFGFSGANFDGGAGTDLWLLSLQGTTLFRSLVGHGSIGTAVGQASVCSNSPIRSFVVTGAFGREFISIHEDGTICRGGAPIPSPEEPVAVEETTWGAVKDKYKFKD